MRGSDRKARNNINKNNCKETMRVRPGNQKDPSGLMWCEELEVLEELQAGDWNTWVSMEELATSQ